MVKKKKYLIFGIIAVVLVSVVGTLAWYTFGTRKSSLVLVLGNSDELLITLSPYELKISAAPVTSYTSMTDYVSVTATNSKTVATGFNFFYDIETIDSALASTAMKYAVTRSTSQSGSYTEVATGSFNGSTNGQHKVIYTENVPATTTYYYRIYTYLDGNVSGSSSLQNKILKTTIAAEIDRITVTFNKNGGSGGTDSVITTYNSPMQNVSVPTKSGSTFKGYYNNSIASDMTYSISSLSTTSYRVSFISSANGWALNSSDAGTHINGKITVSDANLTAPVLDVNDISYTPLKSERIGDNWILYIDLDLTTEMVSQRGNVRYDTSYRFIDLSGLKTSSVVIVNNLTKGGKKYYDASGNSTFFTDFTDDLILTAKW